jgi:hypothetical protein
MSGASSVDFLRRLKPGPPIKITKILADNGSQLTDRFATKNKKPSGSTNSTLPAPMPPQSTGLRLRGSRKRMVWSSTSRTH